MPFWYLVLAGSGLAVGLGTLAFVVYRKSRKLSAPEMALSDTITRKFRRLMLRFGIHSMASIVPFSGKASEVPEDEQQCSELHRLFYGNDGPIVHKWRHYLSVYNRYLSIYRGKPLRLLEIGVSNGGSLHMWRRYFGPQAVLFGIDINPQCATLDGKDGHVRIGSQDDIKFLQNVVAEMGGVDVVIDDGSHIASHQSVSFDVLFPLIEPTGLYICEDIHTSYWRGPHEGGYRRYGTFIEKAKRLVDDLHYDFHEKFQETRAAHRLVESVEFYNSMVVIRKSPQSRPSHIRIGNF